MLGSRQAPHDSRQAVTYSAIFNTSNPPRFSALFHYPNLSILTTTCNQSADGFQTLLSQSPSPLSKQLVPTSQTVGDSHVIHKRQDTTRTGSRHKLVFRLSISCEIRFRGIKIPKSLPYSLAMLPPAGLLNGLKPSRSLYASHQAAPSDISGVTVTRLSYTTTHLACARWCQTLQISPQVPATLL